MSPFEPTKVSADAPELVTVCLACGKIKGEHDGWDMSCEMNAQEFPAECLERDVPGGRVVKVSRPSDRFRADVDAWVDQDPTPRA